MGRKLGDRRDGALLRDLDSMHFITPILNPNRCENEAFISERIDLTNANKYLEKRNAEDPEYRYNLFQLMVTAVLKAVTLRPKMNRFVANKNMYQRNVISAAFVVKKLFSDNGEEALAFLCAKDEDNLDTIHDAIYRKVSACRGEEKDDTSAAMDAFQRLPRFIAKAGVRFVRFLDKHGWVPQALIATDPNYASVFLTNLGSIKLHAGYHHLSNWGTNSVFCVVGEKKLRPYYNEAGNVELRDSVDLGLTVDERIADGYYFSKTMRLLRKLLENPELLERPLIEEVDY